MMTRDQPTTLWTLRRDGRELACQARLEPHGVEIDVTYDGTLSATRSFQTGDEALAWANRRKAEREAQGWRAE